MEAGTSAFADYLLQVENLLIVAACWTLMETIHKIFPRVKSHSIWARFAPAAPILLCSAAVWIPGAVASEVSVGTRILLGIVLGAMTANAHKILKQTALGHDDRIRKGRRS